MDRAIVGLASAVLLIGQAGIGKSRLLDHLAGRASDRSVPFHLVRCERGTTDLDHLFESLAWVDSSNGISGRDPAKLLAPSDVITLDRLHAHTAERSSRESTLVTTKAVTSPIVVAFDDLHTASAAVHEVVDALVHQLRERPSIHLLLAISSRPVPARSRTGETIGELIACESCSTLELSPLSSADEAELVRRLQPAASAAFTGAVRASAQGNPLRVEAAVRLLLDRGVDPTATTVDQQHASPLLFGAGDDDPVATWISAFAEPIETLLECLAVWHEEPTVEQLALLTDLPLADVDLALSEALARGVVATDGQRFWFAHSSYGELVYNRSTLLRRRLLHQRCMQILDRHAGDLDGHGWLAFGRHAAAGSPDTLEAGRVREIYSRAGVAALDTSQWYEAAQFFRLALDHWSDDESPNDTTPDDRERARFLFHCGLAHYFDHDLANAANALRDAASAAEAAGDEELLAHSLIVRFRALNSMRHEAYFSPADLGELNRYIEQASDDDLKAMALEVVAEAHITAGDLDAGRQAADAAFATAQAGATLRTQAMCAYALGYADLVASSPRAAVVALRDAVALAGESGDWYYRSALTARLSYGLLASGELAEAEHIATQAATEARNRGEHSGQALGDTVLSAVSMLRGDFATASRLSRSAAVEARRAGYDGAGFFLGPVDVLSAHHRGDVDEAYAALERWDGLPRGLHRALRHLVEASSQGARGRRIDGNGDRSKRNQVSAAILALEVQRALLENDVDSLRASSHAIDEYLRLGVSFTPMAPLSLERLAAEADLALDRPDDAGRRLSRTSVILGHHEAHTEYALVRLAQAKVAAATSSTDQSRVHAGEARNLAERLGLRTVAAEAEALLGSGVDDLANVQRRGGSWTVILVTDITGSTRVSAELGDLAYHDLVTAHHTIVRQACAAHAGNEIHDSGDGLYFWFQETTDAVEAAREIQRATTLRRASGPRLEVKVALAGGEPLFRDRRPYGLVLNRAARIVDEATGGQIVLDEPTTNTLPAELVAERWKPRTLRGIGQHPIAVLRQGQVDRSRKVIPLRKR